MMNIICTAKDLKKYELQEKSEVTVTIRLSQKIILDKHVISRWKLVEEIEEIYTLTFNFHCALKNIICFIINHTTRYKEMPLEHRY